MKLFRFLLSAISLSQSFISFILFCVCMYIFSFDTRGASSPSSIRIKIVCCANILFELYKALEYSHVLLFSSLSLCRPFVIWLRRQHWSLKHRAGAASHNCVRTHARTRSHDARKPCLREDYVTHGNRTCTPC